ncbi:transient receptor potential cation channel subfamily A member 1 isoform X2 [Nematostella vectensis]|uniref:transient receptor potential cation channel subfamily A member 1 isoform X2 n=1 Tax=Nematostella vectensis TaxID=45351 RepID=UPI00207782E8|nr:transient receptor potential cation channel subfamily A member 1 isoform X2 [Nematostella vectensis]
MSLGLLKSPFRKRHRAPFHNKKRLQDPVDGTKGQVNVNIIDVDQPIPLTRTQRPTSILSAIKDGQTNCVSEFLAREEYRREVNELDSLGLAFLHHAARYDRAEIVVVLVENGSDVDVRSDEGLTPIQVAIRCDSVNTIKRLLELGADPETPDHHGNTALHHAVLQANVHVTKLLLDYPQVHADARNTVQQTPLHLACHLGNLELSEVLISHGVDLRAQASGHLTPLHMAASSKNLKIVKLIVEKALAQEIPAVTLMSDKDIDGNTAFHLAVKAADHNIAGYCLEKGACVNETLNCGSTALHVAAAKGSLECVRLVVEHGAPVNVVDINHRTPLHSAAMMGCTSVIRFLVQHGADLEAVDSDHFTPFLTAVQSGTCYAVEELWNLGANAAATDTLSRNCLQICIEYAHPEALDKLLTISSQMCLSRADIDNKSAIHYAAVTDNYKILETVLSFGPNASPRDSSQQTPLHLAAARGLVQHVEALVRYAAGVNERDDQGRTPLHLAAAGGWKKVCSVLLRSGSDVNAKDAKRATPLMLAAQHGCPKTCQLLLDNQASIVEVTIDMETALSSAIKSNSPGWEEILQHNHDLMRDLIQRFPAAAQIVMDKCIQHTGRPSDPDFTITYDFRFLNSDPDSVEATTGHPFFAPTAMIKHAREDLLLHPLTEKFLATKWRNLGRYAYLFNCAVYIVFLVVYSIFLITESSKPYFGSTNTSTRAAIDLFTAPENATMLRAKWISLVLTCFFFVKELSQIVFQGRGYFKESSNIADWLLIVFTLLYLAPYFLSAEQLESITGDARNGGQYFWSFGLVSIFFTYFNLVLFLRRFEMIGLYIAMLLGVAKTVFRAFMAFSVFILAFAVAFSVLLNKQPSFRNFGYSILRVIVMTTGDLNYDDTFVNSVGKRDSAGSLLNPIPLVAFLLLFFFIVFSVIVMMNLLVGLAVGDIEAIRRQGTLNRLSMMVSYAASLEQKYPRFLLRRVYKDRLVEQPNRSKLKRALRESALKKAFESALDDGDNAKGISDVNDVIKQDVIKNKQRIKAIIMMIEAQNQLLSDLASKDGRDARGTDGGLGQEDNLSSMSEICDAFKRSTDNKL